MARKMLLGLLAIAVWLQLPVVVASAATTHEVVIVLDVSLSMQEADSDGQILNGLRQLVRSFDSNTQVRLIRYDNEIIDTGHGFDQYVDETAERADVENRLAYIANRKYSDTGAALNKAVELLSGGRENARKSIVLVSDNELEVTENGTRSEAKTAASVKQVETIASNISNPYHIYYLCVGYANNKNSTELTDVLPNSAAVTRCELQSAENIAAQISSLTLFLKSLDFELLTPKYIDGAWSAFDKFSTDEEIELYAFFSQDDELLTDLEYLSGFTVTVTYDGTESEMKLAKAQDSFYTLLTFDKAGDYELSVTARNKHTGVLYFGTQTLTIDNGKITTEDEPNIILDKFEPDEEDTGDTPWYYILLQNTALMSFGLAIVWGGVKAFINYRKLRRARLMHEVVTDKLLKVELLDETRSCIKEWLRAIPKMESRNLTNLISQFELNKLQKQTKQSIGAINHITFENKSAALTVINDSDVNCYVGRILIPKGEAFALTAGQSIEFRRTGELQTITIRLSHLQPVPIPESTVQTAK